MSYILLGRISGLEKINTKTGKCLAASVTTINKRLKKRCILPLQVTHGSEVTALFSHLDDAISALVYMEEELLQSGLGNVMHWSVCSGSFTVMKDEKNFPCIGGKDLLQLHRTMQAEKTKNRFFIRTHDRQDDFFLLQALLLWNHFLSQWNLKRDHEILAIFLDGNDYKNAADLMNIARPQAWRKYRSMNMAVYFSIREILLSGRLIQEKTHTEHGSVLIHKP